MVRTRTLQSEVQRQGLQSDLEGRSYNLLVTLMTHRPITLERGSELLTKWDGVMSRRLNGRRFHKPSQLKNRMVRFGVQGIDGNGHLHSHHLISFPHDWMKERFIKCVDEVWSKVISGGTVTVQSNSTEILDRHRRERALRDNDQLITDEFTDVDKKKMVSYLLKHLEVTETGSLDTSVVELSQTF